jgi:hypothetical protein
MRASRAPSDLALETGEGMPTEKRVTDADAVEHIGIVARDVP